MSARRLARVVVVLSATALSALALAQGVQKPFVPEPGEIGKDVMWLPSEDVMVRRMLDAARVTSRDSLVDLGSGDGRIVIAAARRGARALGVEYNPDLVEYAARQAAKARVGGRARFVKGDLFEADLSRASVITLFLEEDINLKLRPKLLELKPGTRIVSNHFTMGEWRADRELAASVKEGCTAYCVAYLWIVPARVDGTWKLPQGELTLTQSYQMITGSLKTAGQDIAVTGRLRGDQISLKAGPAYYRGRVNGNVIGGTIQSGGGFGEWTATRVNKPAAS